MTTTAVPPIRCFAGRGRLAGDRLVRVVQAASAGDQRAWDTLVSEFSGMILATARAHGICDADAADVAQATWVLLFKHLSKLHDPARTGAWLATTARRECLRLLRHKERLVLYGEDTPELESADASPAETVLLEERDDMLWRAFARLRPSDQALLRLLTADPRPSYEEISAALDIPVGSIGPTRQRALDRLRVELERRDSADLLTV